MSLLKRLFHVLCSRSRNQMALHIIKGNYISYNTELFFPPMITLYLFSRHEARASFTHIYI